MRSTFASAAPDLHLILVPTGDIVPWLECVSTSPGLVTAYFGFNNPTLNELTIAVGSLNQFVPSPPVCPLFLRRSCISAPFSIFDLILTPTFGFPSQNGVESKSDNQVLARSFSLLPQLRLLRLLPRYVYSSMAIERFPSDSVEDVQ